METFFQLCLCPNYFTIFEIHHAVCVPDISRTDSVNKKYVYLIRQHSLKYHFFFVLFSKERLLTSPLEGGSNLNKTFSILN